MKNVYAFDLDAFQERLDKAVELLDGDPDGEVTLTRNQMGAFILGTASLAYLKTQEGAVREALENLEECLEGLPQ